MFFSPKTAEASDLRLFISTDRPSYELNSSQIIVSIYLENVNTRPVYVQKRFDLASLLDFELTSPTNGTLQYNRISAQYIDEKIVLQPHEKLSTTIDLKMITFYDYNNSKFEWQRGNYSVQFKYLLTEPDIYSNILMFEIK